jgi:hypothetical protein
MTILGAALAFSIVSAMNSAASPVSASQSPIARLMDIEPAAARRWKVACVSGLTLMVSLMRSGLCSRSGEREGEGVEAMVHSAPHCTAPQEAIRARSRQPSHANVRPTRGTA